VSETVADIPAPAKWLTASWVLYDLANTVFAATITFLFIPLIGSAPAGITNSLAMIVAGLATPLVACLADHTGDAGRYCAVATLVCIGAMAFFGLCSTTGTLLLSFFVAALGYQAALVFYNALLPSVASRRHMGLVSGLGVGFGYIGTVFTLVIALPVRKNLGVGPAFFLTAAAFLVCALPMMLFVRDRRPIQRERVSWQLARSQWSALSRTIRALPRRRALMWFLIGNFFAVDVLNTAILFFAKFIQLSFEPMAEAGHLAILGHNVANIHDFIMIGGLAVNVPALGFGVLLGCLADRFGARRTYVLSIASLCGGLIGAVLFGGRSPLLFLVAMCCFGGIGLAGIWTAGRKYLTELVPYEQVGRYFGIYGITQKLSVIGSSVCGVLMHLYGPRVAILSQVPPLIVAFLCLCAAGKAERR